MSNMLVSGNYDELAGRRVLTLHTINNDHKYVEVFGRGELLGAFYPDTAAGRLAEEIRQEEGDEARNPKIKLDDGEIIWGCECWWMDAYRGDMWLAEMASHGYDIRDISIADVRAMYKEGTK